jgi:hypothetical protein
MQGPTNGAGGGSQPGGTGDASRVQRSASSAANQITATVQKPSRRYSQDTHTTGAHASAAASSGASGMFYHSPSSIWITNCQKSVFKEISKTVCVVERFVF